MLVAIILSLLNYLLFYEVGVQVDDWMKGGIGFDFDRCRWLVVGTLIGMRVGTGVEAGRRAGLSAGEGLLIQAHDDRPHS